MDEEFDSEVELDDDTLLESDFEESTYVEKPYVLLKPCKVPYPDIDSFPVLTIVNPEEELKDIWEEFTDWDSGMAIDLETIGNCCHDLNSKVVMVSLADYRGSISVDLKTSHPDTWMVLLEGLYRFKIPLYSFNINFDAGYIFRDSNSIIPSKDVFELSKGVWHNWKFCVYGLAKHLASEGWYSQRWSQNSLAADLLHIPNAKTEEVYMWLVENGYIKGEIPKAILEKLRATEGTF